MFSLPMIQKVVEFERKLELENLERQNHRQEDPVVVTVASRPIPIIIPSSVRRISVTTATENCVSCD